MCFFLLLCPFPVVELDPVLPCELPEPLELPPVVVEPFDELPVDVLPDVGSVPEEAVLAKPEFEEVAAAAEPAGAA